MLCYLGAQATRSINFAETRHFAGIIVTAFVFVSLSLENAYLCSLLRRRPTEDLIPCQNTTRQNRPTQGEVTSESLWSRHDGHFVRITRAYSKRVFRTNCALRIKSVHPGFPVAFIF